MGAAASVPKSEADALRAGYSQAEIDEYKQQLRASHAAEAKEAKEAKADGKGEREDGGLQLPDIEIRRRAPVVTGQCAHRSQVTLMRAYRKATLAHGPDHLLA